ncbi:hypothetical protein DFH29DRAFT_883259 [Suillus ampliporus]|nr:hypothetical protein DFH29DRAFT_883259 [Suillus ampliporus]
MDGDAAAPHAPTYSVLPIATLSPDSGSPHPAKPSSSATLDPPSGSVVPALQHSMEVDFEGDAMVNDLRAMTLDVMNDNAALLSKQSGLQDAANGVRAELVKLQAQHTATADLVNALSDHIAAQDADIRALHDLRSNIEAVQNQVKVLQEESVARDETLRQAQAQLARQEQATGVLQDAYNALCHRVLGHNQLLSPPFPSPMYHANTPYSGNHSASAIRGPSVGNIAGGSGWNGTGGPSAGRSHNQIAGSSHTVYHLMFIHALLPVIVTTEILCDLWQMPASHTSLHVCRCTADDGERYKTRSCRKPPFPISAGSSILLDWPAVVCNKFGVIILWYLPGAIDLDIQNDMVAATVKMSALLATSVTHGAETGGKWRTHKSNFEPSRHGLTPGCINLSPAWFLQAHPAPKFHPQVSATLKWDGRSLCQAMQRPAALIAAALRVMHPDLYWASLATQLALGLWAADKKLDEMGAHLRVGISIYSCRCCVQPALTLVAPRSSVLSPMTSVSDYGAARMKMPNIGIEIVYGAAAMAVGSGRIIRHGVDMDAGRIAWVWYMRDDVHEFVDMPRAEYSRYHSIVSGTENRT